MQNYNDLLKDILDNGIDKPDRTGIGSRSVFGRMLQYDLGKGFPMITTRKVSFRIAFEETMFFLRGQTDTKILEAKNINIWKGNTSREFLDSRGLTGLPVGSIGKSYSHQMTHWDKYVYSDDQGYESGSGRFNESHINQIEELIDGLKKDPFGRRHIVTHWNPGQLGEMALPPCHLMHMYSVTPDNKLHSSFQMRSSDAYLGLWSNIISYSFMNMAFAKILNLEPGTLTYFGHDVHLYNNQIDAVKKQIQRLPKDLPRLIFKKDFTILDEFLKLEFEDVEIIDYDPHPPLEKVEMAI